MHPKNFLFTVLLCFAAPAGYAQKTTPSGPPPALVQVAQAKLVKVAPTVWQPGAVVSRDSARVAAEVEGRLIYVADVGDQVPAQGELARIDDLELTLQRDEAKAVLERERARKAFAEQELTRLSGLAEKGLITRSRLGLARTERDVAGGEWLAAKARLARLQDRLARTVIKAPFAGVVSERMRRTGERVEPGNEVVRLVNPDSLEIQVRVTHDNLPHLKMGSKLKVTANPDSAIVEVRSVVPVGDEISRLYDVRLGLTEKKWPAGTTVRVAVPAATPREVLAVPRDALVLRQSGISLFKVGENNEAVMVEVTTGAAQDDWIEVKGNINPGDKIITRGNERLRPGQPLRISAKPS